jgi:hypothetical protein
VFHAPSVGISRQIRASIEDANVDKKEATDDELENEFGRADAPATGGGASPPRYGLPRKPAASPKIGARPLLARLRKAVFTRGSGARALAGNIVRLSPALCAVDIALDTPLTWALPTSASLRTRDGTVHAVMLDASAGTRAGTYTAGLRVRVVLHFAGEADDVIALDLVLEDGNKLDIRITEAR